MKSIREPGALLGVEFFEMLDQQLFDQILVDVNAADIDALFDLGVKVCAWCNLYFVFHVNSQKLQSLSKCCCLVGVHMNLVSVAAFGQPIFIVPIRWTDSVVQGKT